MCGIAGFINAAASDGSRTLLSRMLDLIRHRGPDGQGELHHGTLSMGMRRLSIIDIAGGDQPVWNEDRTVAVVFNGEIYNYVELKRELSSHHFRTHSDTEVLVHAWEEFGRAMVHRLRGMFAFAIFDSRSRSLFLARDHFGQKPLYYFHNAQAFGFASELKSLLALPACPRERDPAAFFDYISWMMLPAPRTHFRGVWKLPAGHSMTVPLEDVSRLSVAEFWRYDLTQPASIHEPDDAANELDAALSESVRVHMRADVPVGVLLSGGLDSRAIASYAADYAGEPLHTFSVGFGNNDSELPAALKSSKLLGTVHHAIDVSATQYRDLLDRIAWHLDEPVGDPAAAAVLQVSELARSYVKVILSGEGSDELFAGYACRYASMLETVRRSNLMRRLRPVLPKPDEDHTSRWKRLLRRANTSTAAEIALMRIEGFPGNLHSPTGLNRSQMRRLYSRAEGIGSAHYRPQRDALSSMLLFDIRGQLAESLLQKADKMSMAASIELRTPFLDTAVAACAARLDSRLKLYEGTGKVVLRRCLDRRLPGSSKLPKLGFPLPLRDWFRCPLRDTFEENVLSPNSVVATMLDLREVRQSWQDYLDGKWDGSYAMYSLLLYARWDATLRTVEQTA
jgi:asparagine synthase (glutamine-hydrolysing)